MVTTFIVSIGLMLVLEGIMPLLSPKSWRQTFERLVTMTDGQLRFIGMASMLLGLLILILFH